ncbi:MAG: hypothetical protein KGY70_16955 [Bacteroidales bacterium]|nr:hypothetical protein [Bacteroidales bacterium]
MIQTLIIFLIVAAIMAQVPHVFKVFIDASRLNGSARYIQAGAFCLIVSVAIFVFVWIDEPVLAFAGVGIESIFNLYYYTDDFWRLGMKKRGSEAPKSILKFWRQRWIYFFVSFIIPGFIYQLSVIYHQMFG